MAKRLVILTVLAAVIACGGGWLALASGAGAFVAPGASDVQVHSLSLCTRLVTFRAAPGTDWASQLDRRLRDQGWLPPDYSGASAQFTTYSYVNYYWFGTIWEQADLEGDAEHARIVVRRWLRLRWFVAQAIGF